MSGMAEQSEADASFPLGLGDMAKKIIMIKLFISLNIDNLYFFQV